MARRRKGRAINGVLLVDKPAGLSSNGVLQKIRWLYQAKKAGHTGALDPAATGLLPICLGEATKFTQFLLDADKRYLTTGVFGIETDTLDAEGEVTATYPVPSITCSDLEQIIHAQFSGHCKQVPPMYSALKRDGRKLYELAREGIEIELDARDVTFYANSIINFDLPEFTLDTRCSKGTYIRTLVADIGSAVGSGAHVKTLRRLEHGRFKLEDAHQIESLESLREADDFKSLDGLLLSIDDLLCELPVIHLDEKYSRLFGNGNDVQTAEGVGKSRVYGADGGFIGVGEVTEQMRLKPVRLISRTSE